MQEVRRKFALRRCNLFTPAYLCAACLKASHLLFFNSAANNSAFNAQLQAQKVCLALTDDAAPLAAAPASHAFTSGNSSIR
jgi:hypothetical protein